MIWRGLSFFRSELCDMGGGVGVRSFFGICQFCDMEGSEFSGSEPGVNSIKTLHL